MNPGVDEVDYRETADITKVHAAIKREHSEPSAGMVPIPLWLFGLIVGVAFVGGTYLGMFSGGFNGDTFNERDGLASASGIKGRTGSLDVTTVVEEPPAVIGKKVFSQNCVACHQATGLGVAGAFPPLAKSEWVLGSPKRVTMILLKGLQGEVTVEGAKYNGAMPPWGTNLTDKKIAAVLTYIRSEWGNSAPAITTEQVLSMRKETEAHAASWSEKELKEVPENAAIEVK